MAFDMEQAFGEFKAEFENLNDKIQKNAQSALDEAKRLGVLTDDTKAAVDKALAEQGDLKNRLEDMEASARDLAQRFASGRRSGAGGAKSLGQLVVAEAEDKIKALAKSGVNGDVSLGFFNAITSLPGSAGELLPERRKVRDHRRARKKAGGEGPDHSGRNRPGADQVFPRGVAHRRRRHRAG